MYSLRRLAIGTMGAILRQRMVSPLEISRDLEDPLCGSVEKYGAVRVGAE